MPADEVVADARAKRAFDAVDPDAAGAVDVDGLLKERNFIDVFLFFFDFLIFWVFFLVFLFFSACCDDGWIGWPSPRLPGVKRGKCSLLNEASWFVGRTLDEFCCPKVCDRREGPLLVLFVPAVELPIRVDEPTVFQLLSLVVGVFFL